MSIARESEIGGRLRDFREKLMISRVRFALAVGVGTERLQSYESGRIPLRYGVFQAITKVFFLQPLWLLEGNGDPAGNFPFDDSLFTPQINPRLPFTTICDTILKEYLTGAGQELRDVFEQAAIRLEKVFPHLDQLNPDKKCLDFGFFPTIQRLNILCASLNNKLGPIIKRQQNLEAKHPGKPTIRRDSITPDERRAALASEKDFDIRTHRAGKKA